MAAILLIEDDPHQRALAALVLGSAGHEVREAGNGADGLLLAKSQPPELVVCDVVMPGTNGYQFVAAVRDDPELCTTPVILLTSLSERTQVRVGMAAGADDYLAKPFRPAELLEAVDTLLRRRKAQFDAITGAVKEDYDAALIRQRELLASRYETQLLREINAKWDRQLAEGGEAHYEDAALLAANLFDVISREAASHPEPATLLRRANEAARDALYLFGAAHVLHHGPDLLAIFGPGADGAVPLPNAARAAFALQSATARVLGATTSGQAPPVLAVGLERGPFSLVRLQDPLHGDGGLLAVPGTTLEHAQALRQAAREQGWWLAASAAVAAAVPAAQATPGRELRLEQPALQACELLRVSG
jgi:DNA-binding response OmpR family regulator